VEQVNHRYKASVKSEIYEESKEEILEHDSIEIDIDLKVDSKDQRSKNLSNFAFAKGCLTASSQKSGNSQQAGPNFDEIVKFPMKPAKALKLFLNQLSDYEKGEILDY